MLFPLTFWSSPDYVPASPRKTYSSSSNNSFGVVPIVSPILSLFHDDPYMKVMHTYYAKENLFHHQHLPPSTMLSPMFNPQEFFLPEELLSPKKQGHNQSFSSNSALPQEFEMRESSLELQKAHARIAKLQRKQMRDNNKIALARVQDANTEQNHQRNPKSGHQADK
ncbi:hypothetical protein Tco_0355291 [Tanacetum coccineum]